MTFKDTGTMLAMLTTVYTTRLMPHVDDPAIVVWTKMLEDLDWKQVQVAITAWITTNKYPPTIADIRELLARSNQTETPEQQWSRLLDALRRYGHTMLDQARAALGDLWPGDTDWQYYCQMQEDQLPNEKSRYLRMVTNRQQREKTRAQMPATVLAALDGIGQKRLEEPK